MVEKNKREKGRKKKWSKSPTGGPKVTVETYCAEKAKN